MTHAALVQLAARWLEKTRGCGLVLTEFTCATMETPDAIGWRISEGWSVLVECKTSRADFRRDLLKPSRVDLALAIGQERWYLTTPGLIRPEELPETWGLLEAGVKVRVRKRCPSGPEAGNRWSRGPISREIQANELPFLLSVYRRKFCSRCAQVMFRDRVDGPPPRNVAEALMPRGAREDYELLLEVRQ